MEFRRCESIHAACDGNVRLNHPHFLTSSSWSSKLFVSEWNLIGFNKDRLLRNVIAFCCSMQKTPCDMALLYSPHYLTQSDNKCFSKDFQSSSLRGVLKQGSCFSVNAICKSLQIVQGSCNLCSGKQNVKTVLKWRNTRLTHWTARGLRNLTVSHFAGNWWLVPIL